MALPDQNEFTPELFNVYAQVRNHVFNFVLPMSLKCAIELNIPEIIKNHGKPMTLSELINALPINKTKSHCIHRIMRILVDYNFFIEVDENEGSTYWVTPSSNLLLKDSPISVAPLLWFVLDPLQMNAFGSIGEWFSDDRSAVFETAHGLTFWEKAKTDTRLNKIFNESMQNITRFEIYILLKECAKLFEGVESMVDVGGGTGALTKAVADVFPEMKCTVLDLPHVVAGLEGVNNLNYVGGNMFEAIPTAHVVLIKRVLHDWNDEDCIKILKKCKDAIPIKEKGGKVIVMDMVLGHGEENDTVKRQKVVLDIAMIVYANGKERSEKEWKKMFLDAGFSSYKIIPTLGSTSIIEVYP